MNSLQTNKFVYDRNNRHLLTLKNIFHYVFIVLYHILIASIIAFLCIYGTIGKLSTLCIIYSCLTIAINVMFITYEIMELLKTKRVLTKINKIGYYTSEFKNPVIISAKKINPLTIGALIVSILFLANIIYCIIQYVNNTSNIEKLNIVLLFINVFTITVSSFISSVINDKMYVKQYNLQNK